MFYKYYKPKFKRFIKKRILYHKKKNKLKKGVKIKMSLKKQLFTLFTKLIMYNPYISLTLLKMIYVVIPKKFLEKMVILFNIKK